MDSPKDFKQFEAAVKAAAGVEEPKKRGGLLSAVVSVLAGGIAGATYTGNGGGGGLIGMRYDSFLEDKYKARFEAHKDDPAYVAGLIQEAADKLKMRWS